MLSSTYGSVARLVSDILLSREDASFSFPQVKALKELTKTDEDTRLLISPMFEAAIKEIKEIDPPFDFRDGMEDIYNKSFKMIEEIENENIFMIIVEHVSTLEIPSTLGKFCLSKTKKFGKSSLSYYKYS